MGVNDQRSTFLPGLLITITTQVSDEELLQVDFLLAQIEVVRGYIDVVEAQVCKL